MTSPRRSASSTEKSPATPEFQTPTPASSSSSSSPSPEPEETPRSSFLLQESRQPSPQAEVEEQSSTSPDEPQLSAPAADSGSDLRSILAGRAKAAKKLREEFYPGVCEAVETAGEALNSFLTAEGSMERDQGLFIPDEDDVPAIADPIAGLASRRMPEIAGDPDIADLIALGIGLGRYVMKQWKKSRELRRTRRQLLAQAAVDHVPEEPAEPNPVDVRFPVGV